MVRNFFVEWKNDEYRGSAAAGTAVVRAHSADDVVVQMEINHGVPRARLRRIDPCEGLPCQRCRQPLYDHELIDATAMRYNTSDMGRLQHQLCPPDTTR